MSSREELNPVALRSALVGTRFPARLHHFPTAESTNTLLLEAAANGAPEGTVYLADAQTQGRGRGGHTWHSSPGDGLYLSVLAMPRLPLREALWISLATGLAVQSAIKTVTGLEIDIRWPNDLLLPQPSGPGKKLGGILVEAAVQPGEDAMLRYAVIGIGLNINHESFPPELAPIATSLRIATGEPQSRNALMIAILRALDLELTQLEAHQPDLLDPLRSRLHLGAGQARPGPGARWLHRHHCRSRSQRLSASRRRRSHPAHRTFRRCPRRDVAYQLSRS